MDWFNVAVDIILKMEGAYTKGKYDRGGETNYGISSRYAFPEAKKRGIIPEYYNSVKDLTRDDAIRIYLELYWKPIRGDEIAEIDPKLSIAIFDGYINSGDKAIKILQKIVGSDIDGVIGPNTLFATKNYIDKYGKESLLNNYLNERKAYYDFLKNKYLNDPTIQKNYNGWLNRLEKLKRFLDSLNIDKNLNDYYYSNACWTIPYYLNPYYPEKVRNSLREGTRRIDPLVIDLDGDGIELTDIKESKAMFDLTGSGFANLELDGL